MRRVLSLAALLVVLAVGAFGCGASDGKRPFALVSNAGAATVEAKTARVAMTMEVVGGADRGEPLTMDGAADFDHKVYRLGADIPKAMQDDRGDARIDVVVAGRYGYMQLPADAMKDEGVTTPWIRVDLAKASQALTGATPGGGLSPFENGDPTQVLAALQGAAKDGVKEVGKDDVRGAQTTHYTATVDLQSAIRTAGTITDEARFQQFVKQAGDRAYTVDVWIDGQGRATRLRFEQESIGGMAVRVQQDLYDFGKVAAPHPPPAGQWTDITDKVVQQAQTAQQRAGAGGK